MIVSMVPPHSGVLVQQQQQPLDMPSYGYVVPPAMMIPAAPL